MSLKFAGPPDHDILIWFLPIKVFNLVSLSRVTSIFQVFAKIPGKIHLNALPRTFKVKFLKILTVKAQWLCNLQYYLPRKTQTTRQSARFVNNCSSLTY